ncbi:MAG: hypothetical protein U0835_05535 [Isosphaeraceae bacterium]
MFPRESRLTRRSGRDAQRPDVAAMVEGLRAPRVAHHGPARDLAAGPGPQRLRYAPVGSWGGPLSITVNLQNIGSSEVIEPLSLADGTVSTADATASVMSVFAVRDPQNPASPRVLVGTFAAKPSPRTAWCSSPARSPFLRGRPGSP